MKSNQIDPQSIPSLPVEILERISDIRNKTFKYRVEVLENLGLFRARTALESWEFECEDYDDDDCECDNECSLDYRYNAEATCCSYCDERFKSYRFQLRLTLFTVTWKFHLFNPPLQSRSYFYESWCTIKKKLDYGRIYEATWN